MVQAMYVRSYACTEEAWHKCKHLQHCVSQSSTMVFAEDTVEALCPCTCDSKPHCLRISELLNGGA